MGSIFMIEICIVIPAQAGMTEGRAYLRPILDFMDLIT